MLKRILTAALILIGSASALAHNGDSDGLPGGPGSNGVNVSGGTMIELAGEGAVQFLIAVSYPGVNRETGNEQISYRYFMVGAQTMVAMNAGDEGSLLTSLGLNVVPVSKIVATSHGVISSLRFFPMDVRRELHSGLNSSANVSVIGWTRYTETAVGHEHADEGRSDEPSQEELAKIIKFAQIAVDVVGVRFANLQEHGNFFGSQIASTQVQGGLGWNINRRVSLRVSVGGRGALSMGHAGGGFGMMAESGGAARVQMFLNTARAILNTYFEFGYHRMDLFGRGFADRPDAHDDHGEEHAHSSSGHGHLYLMVGAGAAF